MSHAAIYLEDDPSGAIAIRVEHTEGFDRHSHAHVLSQRIIAWLDEQAISKVGITVE